MPPEYSKKEERETLVDLDLMFQSALDHPAWRDWRTNAIKCFQYKEGDQWTAAELAVLTKRKQPPTVNNQVKVTLDRMIGQFVKQRTRIGFRGRNPVDTKTAEVLSDLFLFIRQNSDGEYEERESAEDGFTGGFGVLETYVSFDDTFRPTIRYRHEDCFNVFPDPYSRRFDWNEDANYVCRAKWVDVEDAKTLYPQHRRKFQSLVQDSAEGLLGTVDAFKKETYVDEKTQRVRLVEIEYKDKKRESICLFGNGVTVDQETLTLRGPEIPPTTISKAELKNLKATTPYKEIDRVKDTLRYGMFCAGILLEDKALDYKRFRWVPYYVQRKKSGEPYSQVLIGLSIQDAINKRESKSLHLLNTNQAIYQKGAVEDKKYFAEELARPDGQLEVRNIEQIRIEKNIDLAVTQFNLHNQAKDDFRRVMGVNPDAMGEKSEVRSGIGIARKIAMTDVILAPAYDNFRRSRGLLAKNLFELVQIYLTEETIFTITDDLGATKAVELNGPTLASIKQATYDVIVEDLPDTTTTQQEQFQQLATTLPQILPFGPFWTAMLIQMSDLRNKKEILEQIQAVSQPPPADPKITVSLKWEELIPAEKAAFAEKMGMEGLAMFETQMGQGGNAAMKLQMEAGKERVKQAGDQQKMQFEAAKMGMEMAHDREMGQLEILKKRMEIQKAVIDARNTDNEARNGED